MHQVLPWPPIQVLLGEWNEEFEQIVKDWIATAKHPKTGKLYTEMVYQPMIELLAYLRANTPTARQKVCRTSSAGRSPRLFMTRRRRTAGWLSA